MLLVVLQTIPSVTVDFLDNVLQWHRARTLKKLRTSKGDYWNKQRLSSSVSLLKMGTSLKGKNSLPQGANSFL